MTLSTTTGLPSSTSETLKVDVDGGKLVNGLLKCKGNMENNDHICEPLSPFEIGLP